jgi:hypothetical protein
MTHRREIEPNMLVSSGKKNLRLPDLRRHNPNNAGIEHLD